MAGLADVAYWRLKMQQLEKESQAEIAELQNALLETVSLRQQAEARAVAAEAEVADATLKLKRTERKVKKKDVKALILPWSSHRVCFWIFYQWTALLLLFSIFCGY
jgi:hypothetical protein